MAIVDANWGSLVGVGEVTHIFIEIGAVEEFHRAVAGGLGRSVGASLTDTKRKERGAAGADCAGRQDPMLVDGDVADGLVEAVLASVTDADFGGDGGVGSKEQVLPVVIVGRNLRRAAQTIGFDLPGDGEGGPKDARKAEDRDGEENSHVTLKR
jgi:hypothetical protein